MGGCRCSFRDCKVNTYKQDRMHFFHFPLKSTERYKKWREYAKTEEMVSYTEVKKKNMVVCARHFRPECFMNYKMDRLTPKAIPTIMRLSTTHAIDFEQDIDNGVLIKLEQPKHKHLLAPTNFECPLDFVNEDLFDKLRELEVDGEENNDLTEGESIITNPRQDSYSVDQMQSDNSVEYVADEVRNYDRVKEKPQRSTLNTVEILETMQVSAPHSKRLRSEVEEPVGVCKKRILNTNVNEAINVIRKPIRNMSASFSQQSAQPTSSCVVDDVENIQTVVHNDLIDQEGNPIFVHNILSDGEDDDDGVEFFEINNDEESLVDDFETKDNNTTIVELKSDNQEDDLTALEMMERKLLAAQQEIGSLKKRNTEAELLKVKISQLENCNSELKDTVRRNEELKKQLRICQLENSRMKNSIKDIEILKDELQQTKTECEILNQTSDECNSLKSDLLSSNKKIQELERSINLYKDLKIKDKDLKEQLELELNEERKKHSQTETKLLQQISALEQSLELSRKQTTTTKNDLSLHKSNINDLQLEKLNLSKQNMEIEQSLQLLQNSYDSLNGEHLNLKVNYNCLQQKYSNLEQKCWKLEALQNQVATITTSLENLPKACPLPQVSQPSNNSLTKAQLFNAIKRYLSASMVSLLRMEMFGSSEREWKPDERQVAVDLLRLGETVYKYITDEWRFRLPALREVRNWLSQTVAVDDEEEL